MVFVPTGSVEVVHVAVLLTPVELGARATEGLQSTVLPFMKTTVPVGGTYNPTGDAVVPSGALAPSSVAVSVTACPDGAGLSELVTVAVGVSGVTVIVTGAEFDGPLVVSSGNGTYDDVNTLTPTCVPVPTFGGHELLLKAGRVHRVGSWTPLYT
jgi:hypothetical protein